MRRPGAGMTLRDLLLVIGTLPLLGVVALRLGAEMGLVAEAPPPEALPASLVAFAVAFVLYVALTLRAIAKATRAILDRERQAAEARQKKAAVADWTVHIERSREVALRSEPEEPAAEGTAEPPSPGERKRLFGEVGSLLTRIPSARDR